MLIKARFESVCPVCNNRIIEGAEVNWTRGEKARHVKCPVTESKTVGKGNNKKAGHCETCGIGLKIGEGKLVFCMEDGGCMKHFDQSGYHLYCMDNASCKARREENKHANELIKKATQLEQERIEKTSKEQRELALKRHEELETGKLYTGTLFMKEVKNRDEQFNIDKYWFYRFAYMTVSDGEIEENIVQVNNIQGDDYRVYYFFATDSVLYDRAVLKNFEILKIGVEEAKTWMSKYSNCYGADMYREFLRIKGEL